MKPINTQDDGLRKSMFKFISLLITIGQNIASNSTRNNQQIVDCHEQIQELLIYIQRFSRHKILANFFSSYYQWMMNKSGGAQLLTQVGIAYSLQAQYQQAIELSKTAQQIYHSNKNLFGEAEILHNLGNIYSSLGQYSQAIDFYQIELSKTDRQLYHSNKNLFREAEILHNLGNIYSSPGQYSQAIDLYQKATNIWSSLNRNYHEAHSLRNIGTIYLSLGQLELGQLEQLRNNYEEAREYYHQALSTFQNLNKKVDEAITLGELGLVNFFLGQAEQGVDMIQKSLSIHRQQYQRNPILEATSLNYLGVTSLLLGQYQQAIDSLQQSLNILQDLSSPPGQAFTLAALGLAFFKDGNLADSERTLHYSINIREDLRSRLIDLHQVSFLDLQIDTYGILQQVTIDKEQPEKALEISERGRARAFAELLALRLPSRSSDRQLDINPPNIDRIREIAREQNTTIIEYSIIYDWFLDEGLQYRRESELFIWVIKPTGEIIYRSIDFELIEDRSSIFYLEELVGKVRGYTDIQDENNSDFESQFIVENHRIYPHLQQLYRILIQPIVEHLPNKPDAIITFIPHGSLFSLPFSALQDEKGNFLIQKHTIITAPSIQVLDLIQKRSVEIPETSLDALVVGNPKMPTIPLTEPPVELQNLAWSKTEAQAIAPLFNTQAITGADATKAYITQLLPKARSIHLATHGLLDDIGQLGIPGAIALAPSDDDNGFLTAGEIYDMKLNAELVVLSACSTGQGKITGDGVIGLSRCLIAAGVKSVIVSLWSVDDLSTALLMVKFYQIFQQKVAAATAINEAQRWLLGVTKTELEVWLKTNERFFDATLKNNLRRRLHQLDDRARLFQHPRYWAAFSAIGQ